MSEDLIKYLERGPRLSPVRAARMASLAALYRRVSPLAGLDAQVAAARIDRLPTLRCADAVVIMAALVDKLQESVEVDTETRDACDAMDAAALVLGGAS